MHWTPIGIYSAALLVGYLVGLTGRKALRYCLMILPFIAVFIIENYPQLFTSETAPYDSAPMFKVLYFTLALPVALLIWLGFYLAQRKKNESGSS